MNIDEGKRENRSTVSLPRQAVPVLGSSKTICPVEEKIRNVKFTSLARKIKLLVAHPGIPGNCRA